MTLAGMLFNSPDHVHVLGYKQVHAVGPQAPGFEGDPTCAPGKGGGLNRARRGVPSGFLCAIFVDRGQVAAGCTLSRIPGSVFTISALEFVPPTLQKAFDSRFRHVRRIIGERSDQNRVTTYLTQ